MPGTTTNERLAAWVEEWAAILQPAAVHWCDGSQEEYDQLCAALVEAGTFTRLDEGKRPNSFWAHSDPGDVARVEDRTFICSATEVDAGPNNNWREPAEMRAELTGAVPRRHARPDALRRPVLDGPARLAHRPHRGAAHGLRLRRGEHAHHDPHGPGRPRRAGRRRAGCRACTPSALRSADGQADVPWPCNPDNKYIVHFPDTREIWSYGSGYGGNALLGKKCFALRIASVMARDDGWLAEHMLILKLTSPAGEVKLRRGRVPVRLRQDQPGHAGPHHPRLDGGDRRRRHLLDEVRGGRAAVRHQPRGRVLRCRPGHRHGHQPQRHATRCGATRSSPTPRSRPRATSGGRG